MDVTELNLGGYVTGRLTGAGIDTVDQLRAHSALELLGIRAFGPASLARVRMALAARGLELRPELRCEGCALSEHPGILVGGNYPWGVQRCDECSTYDGDLEAAQALAAQVGGVAWAYTEPPGLAVRYSDLRTDEEMAEMTAHRVDEWPEGAYIAHLTDPWVEKDGDRIEWRSEP